MLMLIATQCHTYMHVDNYISNIIFNVIASVVGLTRPVCCCVWGWDQPCFWGTCWCRMTVYRRKSRPYRTSGSTSLPPRSPSMSSTPGPTYPSRDLWHLSREANTHVFHYILWTYFVYFMKFILIHLLVQYNQPYYILSSRCFE